MTPRISFEETNNGFMDGLFKISGYLKKSALDPKLHELVNYRISQINGCAYCLDMHYKDSIVLGETEQRLHSLPAWRECPYYSDKERAVLAFVEAVNAGPVEDHIFENLAAFMSKPEIADLTLAVGMISVFNKLNKTFLTVPGNYQPGQYA